MTIDIVVVRGGGDLRAVDIVEPLLGDIPSALARGRNELDELGAYFDPITLELPFKANVQIGKLVQVEDHDFGEVWIGKIVGVSTTIAASGAGYSEQTTLSIMKKKAT